MELTLDQALKKGVEAHKAGQAQEADRYYTAILKANPKHPDANHNMGVLAVGVGKVQEALPFFKTAVEANPKIEQYWLSYIDALIKLERTADARIVLGHVKIKGLVSDSSDQINRLTTFLEMGRKNNAALRNLQEPPSRQVQTLINLYNEGEYEAAQMQASQLLKRFPYSVNIHNNIGIINRALGKLDEAIEAYKKALTLKPDYAEAYNNMGNTLQDQGELDEAVTAYKKALTLKPDYAEAYNNMGVVFKEQGKLRQAMHAYKNALTHKPDYAEVFNNMSATLQDQGKLGAAIKALDKAISLKPNFAEALENLLGLRIQLRQTMFNLEDKYEKSYTPSYALTAKPKYQIYQSIFAFLQADQTSFCKHLKQFSNCDPEMIARLKQKDLVFCTAYNRFLSKLYHSSSSKVAGITNSQTLFHLGESHSLSYAHNSIKIQGMDYTIAPRITFGAKAYHFARKKNDAFKAITKENFYSLPDGSKVFISFGEIDCRPNEGFISAASNLKRPLEDIVFETVQGYVNWFLKQNQNKNHDVYFFNVPAPIYNIRYTAEVNNEVFKAVRLFDNILKEIKSNYFNIIDVFKFTVGSKGFSDGLFHADDHHLSSDAIPKIEQQIGA